MARSDITNKILIWISDSLLALWSLNKGRCHADISTVTLEDILYESDVRRLQILGIWLPRELNEFANYLSHLPFLMGLEERLKRTTAFDLRSRLEKRAGT